MASLKLFQIYDNVAMTVVGVIIATTREEAVVRQFTELCANKETQIGKYPEDYHLLHIGEQNQDTGELTATEPRIIYTGRVWLRMQERAIPTNPDGSSPANGNGAGEQPTGLVEKTITALSDAASDAEEAKRRLLELRTRPGGGMAVSS